MSRQEHPEQSELPDLPPGGPEAPPPGSDQVKEMGEVARLQAEVLEKGLVRESRPVFVFDRKLALEKGGAAKRMARMRERQKADGLETRTVPTALTALLNGKFGGDWDNLLKEVGRQDRGYGVGVKEKADPKSELLEQQVQVLTADLARLHEVCQAAEKRVVLAEMEAEAIRKKPPQTVEKVVEKIIEKVVEKPVLRESAEDRKARKVGEIVLKRQDFRARLARWLLKT